MRENRGKQEGIYLFYESGAAHLVVAQPLRSFTPAPKHKALLEPSPSLRASNQQPSELAAPATLPLGHLLLGFLSSRCKAGCWWGASQPRFG